MFLTRVEFVGFKSFATRTVVDLVPGVIGVVGPNGSGKSNVADGMRWVLGEQSARAVRARKPEEVIFAGSAARQPLGMAEVSLVLDNREGLLPVDFQEVRVSRRLYRSGESEYVLNGSRVRLRDITQLLLHAGLGPDSYAVIGQGAVDELILQRPEERRIALENAADVRRHQIQLAETRSRLASTEGNLARVRDVLAEMAPHLRRLKGQAERAARAEKMHQELRTLQVRYYRARLAEVRREDASASEVLSQLTRALEQSQAAASRAAEELAQHATLVTAAEEQARAARVRAVELREQVRALERQSAVGRERLAQLAEQQAQVEGGLRDLAERAGALDAEYAEVGETVAIAWTPAEDASSVAARARAVEVAAELARARQTAREARAGRAAAEAQWRAAETQLARLEERLQTLASGTARRESEEKRWAPQREQAQAALRELRETLSGLEARAEACRTGLAQTQAAQAATAAQVEATRAAVTAARRETDRLQGRLEGMGVRAVSPSPVASLAAAPSTPLDGRSRIGGSSNGSLQPGTTGSQDVEKEELSAWLSTLEREGILPLGVVDDLAERVPPVARLARGYLRRLVVVEDAPAAQAAFHRLAARGDGGGDGDGDGDRLAWGVVTLDGTLLTRGGERRIALSDDELRAASTWQSQARELQDAWHAATQTLRERERAYEAASAELTAAEGVLLAARRAAEQAEGDARRVRGDERRAREEVARAEAALAAVGRQRSAEASERVQLGATAEAARQARDVARARVAEQTETERLAEETVARLDTESQQQQAEQRQLDQRRAQAEAARVARQQLLDRLRGERVRLAGAQQAAAERGAALGQRQQETAREAGQAEAALHGARQALQDADEHLRQEEDALQQLTAARAPADLAAAAARTRERADQHAREAALLRAQRAQDERESLEREIAGAAESDPQSETWTQQLTLDLLPAERDDGEDLDHLRRRMATVQRDVRAAGDVGDGVLDEYQQMRERVVFLEQQSDDLVQAMGELRRAGEELEQEVARQLSAVFGAVDVAFQACFRVLFGGGEARLVLTRPDDLLQTGVDIVARPPGKKLQALLSLSGGERALTVVALLFGLLQVHPTPFVVLDEVDAALDEANVQRFAKLLKELAQSIQFLVVTHNRATMDVADVLYGVSMDTAGVSRILSVKAQDVAAAKRPPASAAERRAW